MTSDYDDQIDNPPPPPPPWWQAILVAALFFAAMIAAVAFLTSCTCTLDGESVARAIIIYEAGK